MAYVTGLFVVDAPASALNNAGPDTGAKTDNTIAVKKIRTPTGDRPYVSAQAVRYWIRMTLQNAGGKWTAAPVYREGKVAYTAADPISNWDDDLFGYMRAPSKKTDATKDAAATPLEKDREITRISPFRVGTMVAVAPSAIIDDFGTMARQNGDPVPYEHQFYRAHLACLFSLDLTCAGTFFDGERVGIKNLDSNRRKRAEESGLSKVEVRGQTAFRLPIEQRQERVATLLAALGVLDGGAKLTLHYTDVAPSMIFAAVTRSGNHPFARVLTASSRHETELHAEALAEILEAYKNDFLSKIHVGWAKGFLDGERPKLPQHELLLPAVHPRSAIQDLAKELEAKEHQDWYA
ncbi:MAG: type I-B CRISPR-associated protein Cas7/Cst2/DevR [Candidatus Binataceae bacterium]